MTQGTQRARAARFAESARATRGLVTGTAAFDTWLADCRARLTTTVELRPLEALRDWSVDPRTGNVQHASGRFFSVHGLDVRVPGAPVDHWQQPIIAQPEAGILGILVKEFDGVPHCLMQAKAEPGNVNGVQLSPTVQATRSNYSGVHRGRPVPYLEHFRDTAPHRVIADVLQSEQGAWFHRKRNRNLIVETTGPVELLDGFCWLTLGQLHELLRQDDLVNMDTRTVLSCFPAEPDAREAAPEGAESGDSYRDLLRWITEERTRRERHVREIPLNSVAGWRLSEGRVTHEDGLFFDVVGASVEAVGREVARWDQPLLAPHGTGLVALLVREIDGVPHALLHARVEAGHLDVLELAPTVQYTPRSYAHLPPGARPRFLDTVLTAPPQNVLFSAVHSEEGGRFLHARNRYLIVEADPGLDVEDCPDYRWTALPDTAALLRHSHYLNIQARSILACPHGLAGRETRKKP
ncbi:NDP-hexose 2,3-dehydratase [Streptomyces sp. MBRL 601]|uniref:NDP-hexose 2,3-dehydratase family protein n=1 Tax=Streptomyces TaxID=1883 RepID=UPI0005E6FBCA|nr:NDP-hexose 2,3-dehydratase [Streptomyces sp. MBRL 601]WTD07546.1 NDP-hexose 2,3-dehydratase family protein [Streptomyces albidoflavus]